MLGLTLGAFPMLILGSFSFSVNTAAYQALQRRATYQWPTQARFNNAPTSQFVGRELESIELEGWIAPTYRGGHNQMQRLRDLAGTGQPQLLIGGLGSVMGFWTILTVEEKNNEFAAFGLARRQEFKVTLQEYADGFLPNA